MNSSTTLRGSIITLLTVVAATLVPFAASAATLTVSSDATGVSYRNAIVKAADRLVATQNTDGGWDWQNPDANPASGSALNTLGVTAEVLVDAYRLTHQQKYLTAAETTFALLQTNSAAAGFKLRGSDISFLVDLSTITGDSTYADFAKTWWEHDKANFGTGGTATSFGQYVRDLRHSQGLDGLIPWDINLYVQGVEKLANYNPANAAYTSDATDLAQVIFDDAGASTPLFNWQDDTEQGYLFGLTGMLSAMSTVTASTSMTASDVSAKLLSYSNGGALIDLHDPNAQGSTPSVDDHLTTVQTTAYALLALEQAKQDASAQLSYLLAQQDGATGAWLDGSSENTEVDSEAGAAIATQLMTPNTYYSIQFKTR
jgi:hypothetical protein